MLANHEIQTCLEKAEAGHLDAFGPLVKEFHLTIREFLAMLGVRAGAVDDVAQEVFIAAWQGLASFDLDQPFLPWLRGIARNKARQYHAREARDIRQREESLSEFLAQSAPDAGNEWFGDAWLRYLHECMEKLSDRMKELIHQKYHEGLKSHEIAQRLNLSPELVRVTLGRARLALRHCVESLLKLEGARHAR